MSLSARQKAEEFLAVAAQFRLGNLPTEQRHPLTGDLAELSRHDIPAALDILKRIDLGVIAEVKVKEAELARLRTAIADTLAAGSRVFFYGCGATGRLSMSIEYVWRFIYRDNPAMADRVFGFMSGGDLALVHSIENFEDYPDYGARQVREIGFGPDDLLVSTTEGGETPSVIGATEEAARISSRKPFFIYTNPTDVLVAEVERSARVVNNPAIESICLYVGPMSLSGSTRLQSSTALMLGAGWALLAAAGHDIDMSDLATALDRTDLSFLAAFIQKESALYQQGDFLLYETQDHGITILTDTTERSPTFSLLSFENQNNPARLPALSYLYLPQAQTALAAWQKILLRDPVTIEWGELRDIAGRERLLGFDFSLKALEQRRALVAPKKMHLFKITRQGDSLHLTLDGLSAKLDVAGLHPLLEHLLLKMVLNMHSTLVMGRLGRFESNVMTWVKPSNKKLIDRAIRYVQHLLEKEGGKSFSYTEICYQLFAEAEAMTPEESVVLRTLASLRKKS